MSGDPRECRQLAVECLYLAQQATSHSVRQDYTALAHKWMELVDVFESDNALLKSLSAAGWNVVTLEPRWPIKLRAS